MAQVMVTVDESELQDMTIEWYLIEIATDVGVSENTVKDALKLLRLRNSERPAADQSSNDQIAVKILNMIKNGSRRPLPSHLAPRSMQSRASLARQVCGDSSSLQGQR